LKEIFSTLGKLIHSRELLQTLKNWNIYSNAWLLASNFYVSYMVLVGIQIVFAFFVGE